MSTSLSLIRLWVLFSRWPPVWETAVHVAVAGASFMASFVLSFFPMDVLDGIWYLIESFS